MCASPVEYLFYTFVAAVSFPFPGGEIQQATEQAGTWNEQKLGEKWGGSESEGGGR